MPRTRLYLEEAAWTAPFTAQQAHNSLKNAVRLGVARRGKRRLQRDTTFQRSSSFIQSGLYTEAEIRENRNFWRIATGIRFRLLVNITSSQSLSHRFRPGSTATRSRKLLVWPSGQ